MEIKFDGKRALVTGAGKGIGRGIAKKLVACGATVVALSRSQEDLDSLKEECPSIETCTVDLRNWTTARTAVEALGHFDLLVNNAGVSKVAPFMEVKEEHIDYVYEINIKGLINVSQAVVKSMIEHKTGGAIVNLSSAASSRALYDHTVYCSSKGAVDSITQVMALELAPHKIRTNAVNPTVTLTPMAVYAWSDPAKSKPILDKIPLGRFAEVEDVADTVIWLLSDQAAYINGVTLPVEGGLLVS